MVNQENSGVNIDGSIPPYTNTPEQLKQYSVMDVKMRKLILKDWVQALNSYVVRTEELKKYIIVKELGVGGQGRVYKIQKKINATEAKRKGIDLTYYQPVFHAIKVVKK